MERRKFTQEFKLEVVNLIRDRGVSVVQASRDLGVHATVLRRWLKDFAANPQDAFPGNGRQGSEQAEITRLKREVTKLKTEREVASGYAANCAIVSIEHLGTSEAGVDFDTQYFRQLPKPATETSQTDDVIAFVT